LIDSLGSPNREPSPRRKKGGMEKARPTRTRSAATPSSAAGTRKRLRLKPAVWTNRKNQETPMENLPILNSQGLMGNSPNGSRLLRESQADFACNGLAEDFRSLICVLDCVSAVRGRIGRRLEATWAGSARSARSRRCTLRHVRRADRLPQSGSSTRSLSRS